MLKKTLVFKNVPTTACIVSLLFFLSFFSITGDFLYASNPSEDSNRSSSSNNLSLNDSDKKDNEDFSETITEKVEVIGQIPVVKAIQSVSIIKSDEIEKYNLESLKSVLNLTPGVLTLSNGHFGQSSSTSIRGSKSSQILYIVDGIKLRDSAGTSGINLAVLSPLMLDKVEIVRGPLSSMYGSDAMGGVINMNTTAQKGLLFSGSFANHGSYEGGISSTSVLNNFTLGFSANTQRFSDNVKNDVFKNSGTMAKILYKSPILETGVQFFGTLTNSGIPFDDFGKPTPERNFKQNYLIFSVPFVYHLSQQSSVDVKLSYTDSKYTFKDLTDIYSPYFMSNSQNVEAEATYITRLFNKMDLRAGLDYSNQRIVNKNASGVTLPEQNMNYTSSFISTSYNLEPFQIAASIRYDKYRYIDGNFSPQIGISYLIANKLKFRGSYSQSFLAPFLSHMVNPWGASNFNLKPEKGKSFEFGCEYYSAPLTLSATYFNTKYQDMIQWVTIDWNTYVGQFRNIQNVDTYGLEFSATTALVKNLTLSGSYTYLHTLDKTTNEPLLRKPKNTVSACAIYAHKYFTLSTNFIYVGKRPDLNYMMYPPDAINPAFNRFDFNLTVPVTKGLNVFGKLTNAFDKKYQELIGYPALGRRFEIGFKYRVQ